MMIGIFGPTSNRDQAIRAKLGGAKQFGKTILNSVLRRQVHTTRKNYSKQCASKKGAYDNAKLFKISLVV